MRVEQDQYTTQAKVFILLSISQEKLSTLCISIALKGQSYRRPEDFENPTSLNGEPQGEGLGNTGLLFKLRKAQQAFSAKEIPVKDLDGNTVILKGNNFDFGVGKTLESADVALLKRRAGLKAKGERTVTGEKPMGVTEFSKEEAMAELKRRRDPSYVPTVKHPPQAKVEAPNVIETPEVAPNLSDPLGIR